MGIMTVGCRKFLQTRLRESIHLLQGQVGDEFAHPGDKSFLQAVVSISTLTDIVGLPEKASLLRRGACRLMSANNRNSLRLVYSIWDFILRIEHSGNGFLRRNALRSGRFSKSELTHAHSKSLHRSVKAASSNGRPTQR